jgi:hypothetical protein
MPLAILFSLNPAFLEIFHTIFLLGNFISAQPLAGRLKSERLS